MPHNTFTPCEELHSSLQQNVMTPLTGKSLYYQAIRYMGREAINTGTERNGTGSNCTIRTWHWTRNQKLVLIGTVRLCVWTQILHYVTATKTGQALAESHVKRIKLLR